MIYRLKPIYQWTVLIAGFMTFGYLANVWLQSDHNEYGCTNWELPVISNALGSSLGDPVCTHWESIPPRD